MASERTGSGRLILIAAWLMLLVVLASGAAYVMALPPDLERGPGATPAATEVRLSLGSAPPQPPALSPEASAPDTGAPAPEPPAIQSPAPAPDAGGDPDLTADDVERGSERSVAGESADIPQPPAQEPVETAAQQPSTTTLAALPPDDALDPELAETRPSVVTVSASEAEPRTPAWQRHAHRLTPPEGRARIAVVVQGLGLSSAATEAAIERLPAAMSLSFTPYARSSPDWAVRARRNGHEVLVDLPMEPRDFPSRDPGPQALMAEAPRAQNLDRLDWALARGRDAVGVVGHMGSRFMAEPRSAEPVLEEIHARGLMYLDNGELADSAARQLSGSIGLPVVVNDRSIDDGRISRATIEARLIEVERIARENGIAVALAQPFPVTIDVLQSWSRDLSERGFVLVPVTQAVPARYLAETGR